MAIDDRTGDALRAVRSRYDVPAMDCVAEEAAVRSALAPLAGVAEVTIDLTARTVAVDHTGATSAVTGALVALGYGATHVADEAIDAPDVDASEETARHGRQRRALWIALAVNAVFFVGEGLAGWLADSMGLLADGLDMGADAAVYALSLFAVGRAASVKERLATGAAGLELALAVLGLIEIVRRVVGVEERPSVTVMVVVSLLALVGNVITLVTLRGVRDGEVHLEASWIFTANDVKVNVLVIVAALAVAALDHPAPDLLAGAAIFVILANGARRILALRGR